MTDKVQKIREGIENLKSNLVQGACSSQVAMETRCKEEAYDEVLTLLDSMQEEPKKCMYARDNYTDEDRKVTCDGCEEKCIEKVNEERKRDLSLWSLEDFENNFFEIIKPYKDSRNYKNMCIRLLVWRSELWRWIHWKKRKEEPVSETNKVIQKRRCLEEIASTINPFIDEVIEQFDLKNKSIIAKEIQYRGVGLKGDFGENICRSDDEVIYILKEDKAVGLIVIRRTEFNNAEITMVKTEERFKKKSND